jgi:signal transduction histidine kinase
MGTESGSRTQWLRGSTGDAALAVAVGVFVVLTTVIEWTVPVGIQGVPASGWVLIVVASAALAFRRRYPVPVAVIVLVANALYYPLINPDGALLITLIIALYTLAAEGQQVAAAVIGLVAVIGSAYGEFGSASSPLGDAGLFLLLSWLVAAVALGGVARSRRAYLHEAQQRARDAERLRIARDLHDALGHNLALINVQAGAALHGLDRDPDQAANALASIKEASKGALQELRKTLGMLRQIDERAPTAPAPSLARLTELTSRAQDAGLVVRVTSEGEAPDLPSTVDQAAYRIIQESLTNVARHAGASTVVVRINYEPDAVSVVVEDDGRGGPVEDGTGILGMRERAHAVGGSLKVGDRPEGGLRVSARLPYGGVR